MNYVPFSWPAVVAIALGIAACSHTQSNTGEAQGQSAPAAMSGTVPETALNAGVGARGDQIAATAGSLAPTSGLAGRSATTPANAGTGASRLGSAGTISRAAAGATGSGPVAGANPMSAGTQAAGTGAVSGQSAGSGPNAHAGAGATGGAGMMAANMNADMSQVMGPCDIYKSGNTPCVAAHSTVRALYASYSGKLYQVRRASDRKTHDIGVLEPGGFADSAAQDSFCSGTKCTISIIYDQSPQGNHLKSAPAGGAKNTPDKEASATALKLTISGHTVYAVSIDRGMGYRNNKTSAIATGDRPEGEYMVTSGKHYNGGCCFDYGNAETNNRDNGNGTMEAVYFGNCTGWGRGSQNGPWVMADLENGLFAGTNGINFNNTPLTHEYVTAMIKGKPGHFAIKGGDAQSGTLKTMYDGARPTPGYDPMKKEGAIILGIGGDNSNSAVGSFFEGCMTAGYPTDEADDAVQANIIAAGYGH